MTPTLFDSLPNVRPGDPDTSHAAAMPARVTLRDRVRSVLERNPDGLTDHELAGWLFPDPVVAARRKASVGKRRQELDCRPVVRLADGTVTSFVGPLGRGEEYVTRTSPDGFACQVWRLP